MTLDKRTHKDNSRSTLLTACPVDRCEREFKEPAGASRRVHLLNEHDPEDFNL